MTAVKGRRPAHTQSTECLWKSEVCKSNEHPIYQGMVENFKTIKVFSTLRYSRLVTCRQRAFQPFKFELNEVADRGQNPCIADQGLL